MPCCVPSINNENRRRTMKTKTIFKTLAMAMMMPAMLLTTACSSEDDAIVNNPENNNQKGYAIPVTVNVTREGDATTRATYNESEKELEFSSGDQLFVKGTDDTAGTFAGTLTWVSDDTFSGTIYTQNEFSGTADALLGSATTATATLLPAGYGSIGYLSVSNSGAYNATLATNASNAFATSKAAGVAQLSIEQAFTYDDGFALAPQNAILNFTAVTGEGGSAPASSSVSLQVGETTISGSVAPVEGDYSRALANFAIAVADSETPSSLTLPVDGTSVSLGTHALTAGKIYNQKCANINAISPLIQENEKWLVYGTGASSGWQLRIAEGATVTLSNVNLSDASIVYMGNNTIILADGTTNTVTGLGEPAINGMMAGDKTLTIKGTGTLIATGGYDAPAIGIQNPEFESCGDITIENTVTLTATAGAGQSKAITTGDGGGTLTIGGVVYDGGADSPFEYPATAETADVTWDSSVMSGNANLMNGFTYDDVTLSGMGNIMNGSLMPYGECTFTAPSGKKFTKIVISAMNADISGSGWTNGGEPGNRTSTWTGDASTVSFTGSAQGITSIVFTTAPAETGDVTWNSSDMSGNNNLMDGFTNDGVTLSGMGNIRDGSLITAGECTFTNTLGKNFKKIVITATNIANIRGTGWTNGGEPNNWTSTWTGDASTVSFTDNAEGITSIVFTFE